MSGPAREEGAIRPLSPGLARPEPSTEPQPEAGRRLPLARGGPGRRVAQRVSGNENAARSRFTVGRDGSALMSRPGTRDPSQAQATKNEFGERCAEAARRLPAKTQITLRSKTRPSRAGRAKH